MSRSSGVLMHVSSLFGDFSIGSFGDQAKSFVDFLCDCGFSYWQVLPFCMADDMNSPYKSYSAFGGNPYFLDLPTLFEKGLLTQEELDGARQHSAYLCEYDRLALERLPLLRIAASRLDDSARKSISSFISTRPELADAALFMALKVENSFKPWYEWTVNTPSPEELLFWQFVQFEFFEQWQDIKRYANSRGIKLIGDIPIYVAHDSCDVWANKKQFLLSPDDQPSCVAGVPPDYFCEDGQLWGNPIYNWKQMKKDGYSWWSRRLEYMLELFDGVRIDHFRGLESFWCVPADAKTAKEGKWVKGPGRSLIDKFKSLAADKLIIAEDLGDITQSVEALVKYSKFPGMRVFQFAFLGDKQSPHLPHNYPKNCVAYTGTHDNNTLLGHIWEMSPSDRSQMLNYCNCEQNNWDKACKMILKTMLSSHSDTVIFPIQDILGYGADTRMNTPGQAENNWRYRITKEQLSSIDRESLLSLNILYGRI